MGIYAFILVLIGTASAALGQQTGSLIVSPEPKDHQTRCCNATISRRKWIINPAGAHRGEIAGAT